ncbi:MAG: methyltransferase domain-containing protein [Nitrospinota bacterium]
MIIKRSFNKNADQYSKHNRLQRFAAQNLASLIKDEGSLTYQSYLDLGIGDATLTALLKEYINLERIVGVDIAFNMAKLAKEKLQSSLILQGDAEKLPLRSGSFEIVASSLMLQWIADLDRLFLEIGRILKTNGKLFFVTLGAKSLIEIDYSIKEALRVTNRSVELNHLHNFHTEEKLTEALTKSGFNTVTVYSEPKRSYYSDVKMLLKSIKGVGASSGYALSRHGLGRRQIMDQFLDIYSRNFSTSANNVYATYNLLYFHATLR